MSSIQFIIHIVRIWSPQLNCSSMVKSPVNDYYSRGARVFQPMLNKNKTSFEVDISDHPIAITLCILASLRLMKTWNCLNDSIFPASRIATHNRGAVIKPFYSKHLWLEARGVPDASQASLTKLAVSLIW